MGLISKFRSAAWGVKTAAKGAWNAVAHPQDTFKAMQDLRGILRHFDKIPGIEERRADADFMNKTVLILQMGRVALCVTHDSGERTDIGVYHIDPVTAAGADRATGTTGNFYAGVLSDGGRPDEPNISLIVNKDNFSRNPDKMLSDTLVAASTFYMQRIPWVGGIGAKIVGWPVRKTADLLLGFIFEQAKNLIAAIPAPKAGKTAERPPMPPLAPPSSEAPRAPV